MAEFTNMDLAPEEDQDLARAMNEDVAGSISTAIDLAASVKEELFKDVPGGLVAYIKASKADAIASLVRLFSLDLSNEKKALEVVREIQRDYDIYTRAVAFAGNALTGYIGAGEDDDAES